MSKELEIVRKLQHCGVKEYRIALEKVEQIILEYEQIENANPSEALKELERIKNQLFEYFKSTEVRTDDMEDYEKFIFEPIKQTLLKAQEQEKVLEIIKEKNVDVEYLSKCNNVKEYNAHWCYERFYLTEEEFDLLKRWLG